MTFAIVKVLPEPVTPSSVWNARPSLQSLRQHFDRSRLIAGRFERLIQLKWTVRKGQANTFLHRNSAQASANASIAVQKSLYLTEGRL